MNSQSTSKPIRVPFDSLTLRAVVYELTSVIVGGQIQEIRQPEPNEITLGIRADGTNFLLLLSADARFARVHLTTEKRANSPTPSAFLTALRKHLLNGRILSVIQSGFDRILELVVQTRNEDGDTAEVALIAELMGKHSNLILVGPEGRVIEAAKRISHRVNRFRETLPGQPYASPPPQPGTYSPFLPWTELHPIFVEMGLEGASREAAEKIFMEQFEGLSPFLAAEIAYRASRNDGKTVEIVALTLAWQELLGYAATNAYRPSEVELANIPAAYPYPPLQFKVPATNLSSLNTGLDRSYSKLMQSAELTRLKGDLTSRMERTMRRIDKQRSDAERTLQESERAEEYQQQGDLLLAHLWKMEQGAKKVVVQDFYSPEQGERTITLDPKRNPQENAQAYFRKAQKARDSQERAALRLQEAQESLQRIAAARAELTDYLNEPNLQAKTLELFEKRLKQEGLLTEETQGEGAETSGPDFQGHRIRRYKSPEEYEIFWGESATANDFLTTRIASANDLWLHVRASTGSHVVIRTKGQPERVPNSVLYRAARIAALHSSQKHSSLVPVDYTLKKYVRKPRGSEPGSVEIQREKTLHVNPAESDVRE